MSAFVLLILAAFGQLAEGAPSSGVPVSAPGADPTFTASIRAPNDRRIPAEVEGLITTMTAVEGARVTKGTVLATIDDRQVLAQQEVARIGFRAADEKAKDEIEEKYAMKAAAVALKDYQMGLEANASGRQVISPIDLEKKKLDYERARLQIEKAQKDQVLARLDADVKQAELDLAGVALTRRTIIAPFDGEVQLLLLHQSEWANPGDPILRLVQFDVMYVECPVSTAEFDPAELQGRPVTVVVNLARNRQATVEGRIVMASQLVVDMNKGYGQYLVRAEVKNERVRDFWLVRPGLPASMTIHVKQPAIQPAEAAQAAPRIEQR
jgi:multidrug resistance efflux pump